MVTIALTSVLGIAAGLLLRPSVDRNIIKKWRLNVVNEELEHKLLILNQRRHEIEVAEKRLEELEADAAWLNQVRSEAEIWTDRLNNVRVELGNIDQSCVELADVKAELARFYRQRAALAEEVRLLAGRVGALKRPVPNPPDSPSGVATILTASPSNIAHISATTVEKPRYTASNRGFLDVVFRAVDRALKRPVLPGPTKKRRTN